MTLRWDVNYLEEKIYFRLVYRFVEKGWLVFGFSDYGDVREADVVLYGIDSRKNQYFKDCWTDKLGKLHTDSQQDYILTETASGQGFLGIEFHRKFDTCDTHDYMIDNGTTHIIFMVGNEDSPVKLSLDVKDVGLQRVQLLKPDIPPPRLPSDVWSFEIRAPAIEVPATDTTYWWYTTKLPILSRKHHIVKYEGIIQEKNNNLVHHMEVFHCEVEHDDVIPKFSGPGAAEGKPPKLESCRKVIGAWAMGAEAMVLPEEAGTPIGGPDYSPYVLLEIHYNNPQLKQGVRDSSGIRFYVSSILRPYDSGIMELGLEYTNKMAIPPRQHLFSLTGYCIPACTRIGLPRHGINVYASQLHTHMTGKRVFTKHVRRGVELPELNRDNHYSPHFQEIRKLPQLVTVLPGDSLVTTCEDSTESRPNVTVGGFSIREEMCVNYIHYYPKVDLEVCKSSIADSSLRQFFDFIARWNNPTVSRERGVKENYQSIHWTPTIVETLTSLYLTAPISMQCNHSDGRRFKVICDDMTINV
ncbi:hypothetical protein FSP39_007304 [Pinctada imbricata]|uniref:DOMON domain-containing protein n=1 Tax=Pinctada imbricata TaxID=66713 RepID=A0AA89BN36_PINIB|nr:hypothetical protein FSP39_007304 [Pinctada imbricata]